MAYQPTENYIQISSDELSSIYAEYRQLRLINADLLAACEEILSLLPGAVYIVEDNYSDLASQIEQAKEKIEAAIAKAKGE